MHYINQLHGDVILKAKRIKIIFFVPKLNLLYSLLRTLKVHCKYNFERESWQRNTYFLLGYLKMLMICNRVHFVLNVQYELISSEAEQSLQTSTVVFQNKAHFGKPVTEKPKTVILEMFFLSNKQHLSPVYWLYWYICAIQKLINNPNITNSYQSI